MNRKFLTERLASTALAVVLATFFGFVYTPVWDSDFWWHLASGRWIVEHNQVPSSDPFAVYSAGDTVRNDTVLRAQWLGQVVFYAVYRAADEAGIISLRATLLTLCLFLVYSRARYLGAPRWASWAVLIPCGLIALGFTSDRPQLFSYLFAALVFMGVDHYERTGLTRWLIPIPFIGTVWANTHGGFLIVVAALVLYVATTWVGTMRFVTREPADHHRRRGLFAVTLAFIFCSLIGANGLMTYRYLIDLQGTGVQQATSEYVSAFKLYQFGYVVPQIWVALIYVAGLVASAGLYRRARPKLAVLIFLGLVSALHYRYFAFVVFITGPYIASGLGVVWPDAIKPKLESMLVIAFSTVAAVLLVVGVANRWALRGGVNETMFPVAATEVLRHQRGKIFNHMQWGGYLIWHLYPDAGVYIDGRVLDRDKFDRYTHILWATPSGVDLLHQERFDLVVLPLRNRFTGERYLLPDYLDNNERWHVIYRDPDSRVYQRRL